jgi:TATA-binding protein-associated factor
MPNIVDLYGFQQRNVNKLSKPKIIGRLIGDDMGLGKTVQALYLDKLDRQNAKLAGKTLIVAPLGTLDAWEEHTKAIFGISARVVVVNPKDRPAFIAALRKPYTHYIVHWEGMRLMIKELLKIKWFHIIADEVHRIKNRKAQVTMALKALKADKKTGCSGTPADDKPQDLWSINNWLWPTVYKSYWRFVKHYCVFEEEINWSNGQTYRKFKGVQNAQSLHREMEPWFVRNLKEEVLKDLPPKVYQDIWVELTPKQRKAYEQMKQDQIAWVENQSKIEPVVAPVVIAQLTRLQQFALGYMEPFMVEKKVPAKELPARRIWSKANEEWYDIPAKSIPEQTIEVQKWKISDPSAKLDAFMQLLEDNPNENFVVYSQFKSVLKLLSNRLSKKKIPHGLYTGDMDKKDRDRNKDLFAKGRLRVFAATFGAGREGIDGLQEASRTAVFLDRSWKPTWNRQAEDRLHRIGQAGSVLIIDIMAKDTVDLGRRQHIKQKWEFIREILGDARRVQQREVNGKSWQHELVDEAMDDVFDIAFGGS